MIKAPSVFGFHWEEDRSDRQEVPLTRRISGFLVRKRCDVTAPEGVGEQYRVVN